MRDHYDIDEILELAEQGMSAAFIREELGLGVSVRRVQQIIHDRLGTRPSRASIERRNPLREAVVKYMEANGLNRYYCYLGHRRVRPCAIRQLGHDIDSLVFVCDREATVADF